MKEHIFPRFALMVIVLTGMFFSCEPPRESFPDTVKLSATLNNTNKTIHIGDTLKFTLTIPDTIQTSSRRVRVVSMDDDGLNGYYNFSIDKIDTANKTIYPQDSIKAYISVNPGGKTICDYCIQAQVYFTRQKPYRSVLNFVPKAKGIYYIEIINQAGVLKLNNGDVKARLVVNFDVPDKHFDLITKYHSLPNDKLVVLQQRDAEGFGTYAFEVQ